MSSFLVGSISEFGSALAVLVVAVAVAILLSLRAWIVVNHVTVSNRDFAWLTVAVVVLLLLFLYLVYYRFKTFG